MADTLSSLGKVLQEASSFSWKHALYLPKNYELKLSTACAVLDPDEGDPEPDDVPFAVSNGLIYVLRFHDVQQIVENVRQQKRDASPEALLRALEYYLKNDAFIDLESV